MERRFTYKCILTKQVFNFENNFILNMRINKYINIPNHLYPLSSLPHKIERISVVRGRLDKGF